MNKKLLLIMLIPTICFASSYGGHSSTRIGEWKVHDNNNYWLTVYEEHFEAGGGEDGPAGEYPANSGIDNLYKSGVWVGVKYDNEYKVIDTGFGYPEYSAVGDFYSSDGYWPSNHPRYGDYDTTILCDDGNATGLGPIPILIRRQTWSFTDQSLDDCIGIKYIIRNDSNYTYDFVYVSHFVDFDVPYDDAEDDCVNCDPGRELGYMYDGVGSSSGYFGVTCGFGEWVGVGMNKWHIGIDPDTDRERYDRQRYYEWPYSSVPRDYRFILTLEFDGGDFEPGETITAGFYQVAGDDLAELQANADTARASYVNDDPPLGIENIKSASLGVIKALFR